jgi:hypothetical protein
MLKLSLPEKFEIYDVAEFFFVVSCLLIVTFR